MAKKPKAAETALGEIDPAAEYEVKLHRAVKHGPTWLKPGAERLRLIGATVIEIGDAVASAKKVS